MDKIVISIGHFKVKNVEDYLNKGFTVIAYDPRKEVYVNYLKIINKRFHPFDFAVLADEGKTSINLRVIRDKALLDNLGTDCFLGSSTYQKGEIGGERFTLMSEYSVKAVSLISVLNKFTEIEELHINCEGEEIPMIMNNSVDLFLRCKRIYVEFHCHVSHLNMTEQMVAKCVERWEVNFISTKLDYKPNYRFDRKD